jgi:hypothetical protein
MDVARASSLTPTVNCPTKPHLPKIFLHQVPSSLQQQLIVNTQSSSHSLQPATMGYTDLDKLAINTIRILAVSLFQLR